MNTKKNNGKFVLHHSKQNKPSNTYIYYSLAWYYREYKKPFRNILKNLGKLNQNEIEHYSKAVDCMNRENGVRPCKMDQLYVRESKSYLSCAVGLHFWDHWKLSSVFDNYSKKKDVQTSDIAKILTVMRLTKPSSKNFTTEIFNETVLARLIKISTNCYNKSRIFRELEQIENYSEKLGKHIFNMAKKKKYTKGNLLFYDLSSANFSGLRCVMAKWGHCKDGYQVHVVLLLVITPEGYPVYWQILEGNTADAKTIEHLILKIEQVYGKIESVVCFDRGMVSDENLKILEKKNIRFITALDGNQIQYFSRMINFKLIEQAKKYHPQKEVAQINKCFEDSEFHHADKNLFYKELELSQSQKKDIECQTQKLELETRRYFLAFNPELAFLTQRHRMERVVDFKDWLKEYNEELAKALKSIRQEKVEKNIKKKLKKLRITDVKINYRLTKYQAVNMNQKGKLKRPTTYRIELEEVTDKDYENAGKYDGFWVLVTNITAGQEDEFFKNTNFSNYLQVYRLKNNIEEAFRIMSDFVQVEPFYVFLEKHIKAHFTICVLSYLIDITILNKIRACKNIENMSLHRIFHHLEKCKQDFIHVDQGVVVTNITKPTEMQQKTLEALDCHYLIEPPFLAKNNIITVEDNGFMAGR
jgi:transposase